MGNPKSKPKREAEVAPKVKINTKEEDELRRDTENAKKISKEPQL